MENTKTTARQRADDIKNYKLQNLAKNNENQAELMLSFHFRFTQETAFSCASLHTATPPN